MFDGEPVIDGWDSGARFVGFPFNNMIANSNSSWAFNVSEKLSDFADFSGRLAYACKHFRWDVSCPAVYSPQLGRS